ncbi:MAG TPA: organic hydroperoxide resistance protein [Kofleriaceae bacterium]|nr:organic hydroperoxide resistance protein [Kofleriaceae bacterium]
MSSTPAILEKRLYTASATSTGGRDGRARTDDGTLDLAIAPPKGLGGTGNGTNPEQLFATGYAACFASAIGAVARAKKVTPGPVTVTTKVTLGTLGQGYGLAVELEASLPELPRDQAEALVQAAHQVCPYSNATRGNIVVDVKLAER